MKEKTIRFCELKEKEVINCCNCKRLGCVTDVIIDVCCGKIEAIVLPGPGKLCGFLGYDEEYIIPFECICKIGPDVILVEIQEERYLKPCKA